MAVSSLCASVREVYLERAESISSHKRSINTTTLESTVRARVYSGSNAVRARVYSGSIVAHLALTYSNTSCFSGLLISLLLREYSSHSKPNLAAPTVHGGGGQYGQRGGWYKQRGVSIHAKGGGSV